MKVGVFDSGLGGLTVVRALRHALPAARIEYLADTRHAPYGEKTHEQIRDFSLEIARYFVHERGVDALVVACNTATSAAIADLRRAFPRPAHCRYRTGDQAGTRKQQQPYRRHPRDSGDAGGGQIPGTGRPALQRYARDSV